MEYRLALILVFAALSQLRADEKIAHMAPETVDKNVAAATLVSKYQEAPDFSCQTTDGIKFNLAALKGKVVVLYFFSASVGASIIEMKDMEAEIFQKLRGREDFEMIAIGRGHSREELVKIGGENKLTFPLVADPKRELYGRYFKNYVPRTMVVRKDGTIGYLASGYDELKSLPRLQAVLTSELAVKTP